MINNILNTLRYFKQKYYHRIFPKVERFTQKEFEQREQWENFKEDYQLLGEIIAKYIPFESILDVGCGNGFLMNPFLKMGKKVKGIEISEDVLNVISDELRAFVTIADFSDIKGKYDLLCCIEVAEHIKPRRSKSLVKNLCKSSNKYIFFTAALPGQPGHGHINCRPQNDWIKWFRKEGWHRDTKIENQIKNNLIYLNRINYILDNMIVFHNAKHS